MGTVVSNAPDEGDPPAAAPPQEAAAAPRPPSVLRQALLFAAFVAALGLLAWLLHTIGWETIAGSFVMVGVAGAALLAVIGLLENALDAVALREALQGRVGLLRLLSYNGATAITNMFVPWSGGEILRTTMLARHSSTSDALMGTILWNYAFKLTRPLAAALAAAVGLVAGPQLPPGVAVALGIASVAAFAPYVLLRWVVRRGAAVMVMRVLRRLRLIRRDPDAVVASAAALDARVREFASTHPKHYRRVLVAQLLARVSAWLAVYATASLLDLGYSFGLCSVIYASFSLASYIVVLAPAKIGVGEGSGWVVFSILGLPPATGVIIFVIGRIKSVVTNGAAALFAFRARVS